MPKNWKITVPSPALQKQLSESLGITPILAQLLINRGLGEPGAARAYLDRTPETGRGGAIKGLAQAVERITRAVSEDQLITVYGDYDVDGITGTAILLQAITTVGGQAGHYLPDRMKEGYGLNLSAIEKLAVQGTRLLISVDCGTTSVAEIARARELGVDVIVVDHHELLPDVPEAYALINPHQPDCPYPFDGLCGAGLAYKLGEAILLGFGKGGESESLLDLAAVGTVADMVPLRGENRHLVARGLALLNQGTRPGFKALRDVAGIGDQAVVSHHLAFVLGPRINAGGRIADPALGLKLLLSRTYADAEPLARALDEENRHRQEIERKSVAQARAMAEPQLKDRFEKAIVLADDAWHPGVIGLVASRLTQEFCRPSVVVSFLQGEGKGSARSVEGFHLTQALEKCRATLTRFGGHAMAAGLSVERGRFTEFEAAFLDVAREGMPGGALAPTLKVDVQVTLADLQPALLKELDRMEPFGVDNPAPLFGVLGAQLVGMPRLVGGDKHLKFSVKGSGRVMDAIYFRGGSRIQELVPGLSLDLVFSPSINRWNGNETLQLEIRDLRSSRLAEVAR